MSPADVLLCGQCQASFTVPTKLLEHPTTSLTAKIRANHIPGRTEKHEISGILVEAREQLLRYEEELSRLRDITAQMESQRETLQQLVDGYQCLQAPVRRLPTEVLHDIFSLADWGDWGTSFYTEETPRPTGLSPLSLSVVCSRWRAIVLDTPQLWTSVSVDLRLNHVGCPYTLGALMSIFERYLERSRTLPLSIRLCNSDEYSDDFPNLNHPYLHALAQNSHRWRCAKLDLCNEYYHEEGLLVAMREELPILQTLQIEQAGFIGDIFEICPMLSRVSLQFYVHEMHILPWEQITVLHTDESLSPRDWLAIFPLCLRIKELRLSANYITDGQPRYDPTSSELESLTIVLEKCDEPNDDPLGFLDALTLPSLTFFEMEAQRGEAWDVPTSLSTLFCRSKCPLQTLILNHAPMYAPELVQTVAAMPTITELRLTGHNGLQITTALLQSLTYPARSSESSDSGPLAAPPAPLLPRLKHLALTVTHHDGVDPLDDTVLLDMLESRRSAEVLQAFGSGEWASLETVAILPVQILSPLSLTRFRRLRSEGLRVIHPCVD